MHIECSSDNNSSIVESEIYDIQESFVRSDIAEIISKMYTPLAQGEGWKVDETPNKRFGFYFESISERHNFGPSVDSSTSDVVSLPSVKSQLKQRSGFVCKCCKQQIHNRISEKRKKNACLNCKRKHLEKGRINNYKTEGGQQHCDGKGQRGEYVTEKTFEKCTNSVCKIQDVQKISQERDIDRNAQDIVPPELKCHVKDDERSPVTAKKDSNYLLRTICNYSDKCTTVQHHSDSVESLQVVPHISEGENKYEERRSYNYSKEDNETVFTRLFRGVSSWPGIFNKKPNKYHTTKASDVNVPIRNVIIDLDLKKEREDAQKQRLETSQYSRNTQHLSNKTHEIDTIFERNQDNHSKIEPSLAFQKSTLIKTNMKIPFSHECQHFPQIPDHELENKIIETNKSVSFKDKSKWSKLCKNERNTFKFAKEVKQSLNEKEINDKNQKVCTFYEGPQINETNTMYAEIFWGNVFRIVHEAVSFFTCFALHLLKFVLRSVVHPVVWGTIQVLSEYFFQPCLTVTFESLVKPVFVLMQNIAECVRDLCQPVSQTLGYFLTACSSICRACRLVDICHIHGECQHHEHSIPRLDAIRTCNFQNR